MWEIHAGAILKLSSPTAVCGGARGWGELALTSPGCPLLRFSCPGPMALLSQGAQHHGVIKLRGERGCRTSLGLVLQLDTS